MGKNTNNIKLVLDDAGLRRFNQTPTFKNLLHENQLNELIVGDNLLTVNQPILGTLRAFSDTHMKIELVK